MRSFMKLMARISASASLVVAVGCGGSPPSVDTSTAEATVKGVVKIDGKPATEGDISFDPSNYKRPAPVVSAPIGKDGSYTIKTMVGENTVKLGGSLTKKYQILQYNKTSFNVQAGENTFDYDASAK